MLPANTVHENAKRSSAAWSKQVDKNRQFSAGHQLGDAPWPQDPGPVIPGPEVPDPSQAPPEIPMPVDPVQPPMPGPIEPQPEVPAQPESW